MMIFILLLLLLFYFILFFSLLVVSEMNMVSNPSPTVDEKGNLNLSGLIVSKLFVSMGVGPRIDIETFLSREKSFINIPDNKVRKIILRRCNLLDQDMEDVVKLVAHPKFKECITIDLSDNRFHGLRPPMRARLDPSLILLLKDERFVDVSGSPFASVDRCDFFDTIEAKLLLKLIWVPQFWLSGRGWPELLRGRSDFDTIVEQVLNVHRTYYAFMI